MNRKMVIWSLLLMLGWQSVNAQSTNESADDILKKAQIEAKQEQKNVFIKYEASWCSWCKRMKKLMHSEELAPLFKDNYVEVSLVVMESEGNKYKETPGAEQLLMNQGGIDAGLPFWLITDSDGNILANSFMSNGENTGSPASLEEVAYFTGVLKKTSNLTPEQLALIGEKFTLPQ